LLYFKVPPRSNMLPGAKFLGLASAATRTVVVNLELERWSGLGRVLGAVGK
jgi:hypothetical protein